MKLFKRALLACGVILMFLLSGCNKAPTAEELVAGGLAMDLSGYFDIGVTMSISVNDAESPGQLTYDMSVEGGNGIVHVYDMTVSMSGGGYSLDVSSESWYDGEASYTNSEAFGKSSGWLKESDVVVSVDDLAAMAERLWTEGAELSMDTLDDSYAVSWPVDASTALSSVDSLSDGMPVQTSIGNVTARVCFDKETRAVRCVSLKTDGTGTDGDISVSIVVRNPDVGKVLEIPEEVLSSAVDSAWNAGGGDGTSDGDHAVLPGLSDYINNNHGEFGEIGEDGWVADIIWMDDGEDEVMDALARRIEELDPGFNVMEVSHYSDGTTEILYNSGAANVWNGTMSIMRYDDDAGAAAYVEETYRMAESLYGTPVELVESGGTVRYAVFVQRPEEGGYYVYVTGYDADVGMSFIVYDWSETGPEGAVEHAMLMVDVTERDWKGQ